MIAKGVHSSAAHQAGPHEIGFAYEFIMAAKGDRAPCAIMETHRIGGLETNDPIRVSFKSNFPGEPTGKDNPELRTPHPGPGHDQSVLTGITRIDSMTGGKAALRKEENLGDTLHRWKLKEL